MEFPNALRDISRGADTQIFFSHWNSPAESCNLISTWEYRRIAGKIYDSVIEKVAPDLLLILSPFEGLGDDCVWSVNDQIPTVSIFYDAIPMIFENEYLSDEKEKIWYEERVDLLKKCNGLISISENSKKDAQTILGINTSQHITIEAGLERATIKLANEAIPWSDENRPYLFSILGEDFRKNKKNLLHAFHHLVQREAFEHNLLIAYKQSKDEMEANALLLQELELENRVRFLDYVPDTELFSYLSGADLFVFPSLYEGLGLPVLEAWACSTPVVASFSSSLNELFDSNVFLFDPNDPKDIAEVVIKVLSSDELKEKNIAEGHIRAAKHQSLESGGVIWNFLEQVSKDSSRDGVEEPTSDPLRLAFFTPLPPQKSGISSHAIELLPTLTKNFSIKVFTERFSPELNESHWSYSELVHPISEFNSDEFDVCLYNIGNSEFHIESAKILEKNPGIVILHDAYLSGLAWITTVHTGNQSEFAKMLYKQGGSIALSNFLRGEPIEKIIASLMLNGFVIEKATSLVVHSQYSKELIRRDYEYFDNVDIRVLPQQHQVTAGLGLLDQTEETNISFATFGAIAETKSCGKLLAAWKGSLAERSGQATLYFVGENLSTDIEDNIKELDLNDTVTITGYLPTEEYAKFLHRIDVGIQLRRSSRGETSRALLDVMSAGKPVIANANGSFSEFRDYGAIMLEDDFEIFELRHAIDSLYVDEVLRATLGQLNLEKIHTNHSIASYSAELVDLIKAGYQASRDFPEGKTRQISRFAKESGISLDNRQLNNIFDSIVQNFPHNFRRRRILVDITHLLDYEPGAKEREEILQIFKELSELLPFLDLRFVGTGLWKSGFVDIPQFMSKFFTMETADFPMIRVNVDVLSTAFWAFNADSPSEDFHTIGELMSELRRILVEKYLKA